MKRIISLITALCLSTGLLSGCGGDAGGETKAMGRYIEQEGELLTQVTRVNDFHMDGAGSLVFYAWNTGEEGGTVERCVLSAGGALERSPVSWINGLSGVSHVSESGDGRTYALAEDEGGGHVLWRSVDGGAPEQIPVSDWTQPAGPGSGVSGGADGGVMVSAPGAAASVSGAVSDGAMFAVQEGLKSPSGVKALPGGDFLILYGDKGVSRYGSDGALKGEFAGVTYTGGVAVYENTLLLGGSDGSSLWSYDLDSGKRTQRYDVESMPIGASIGLDGEGAYLADSTGISRQAAGGSVWERLVDGGLTSLAMPTLRVQGLVSDGGGGFWAALTGEEDTQLFHYVYDPDTPATPDTELSLFGLKENNTVRQAVGEFQRRNPNVRVNYRVGLDEKTAATAEEVIRALNTELLSGKGPDLLLLDGLPVESYMEKGVLEDLSDLVDGGQDLPANLMNAYRREGGIYGVPARFTVPVMMGGGEAVDAVRSLADLAGRAEALQGGEPPFLSPPISLWEEGGVLMQYYDACAGAFTRDGLDEAALCAYFTQTTALNGVLRAHTPQAGETMAMYVTVAGGGSGFEVLDPGLMALERGQALFHIQDLAGRFSLESALSALRRGEGRKLAPLFHGDCYTPVGSVGVVASGEQRELARSFLETLLSPAVQDNYLYDGFPVNAASLEKMAAGAAGEGDDMGFLALCQRLNTPILVDSVVKDAVQEQAKGLADGSLTPEQAAANVAAQVRIYLAE